MADKEREEKIQLKDYLSYRIGEACEAIFQLKKSSYDLLDKVIPGSSLDKKVRKFIKKTDLFYSWLSSFEC